LKLTVILEVDSLGLELPTLDLLLFCAKRRSDVGDLSASGIKRFLQLLDLGLQLLFRAPQLRHLVGLLLSQLGLLLLVLLLQLLYFSLQLGDLSMLLCKCNLAGGHKQAKEKISAES
jgi:hypothetical protein